MSEEEPLRKGFSDHCWVVHKFGGTSVADAACYLQVAAILESVLGVETHRSPQPSLAVVVSAMGGKPKVTDLLLDAVKYASERNEEQVESVLKHVYDKHHTCLKALFEPEQQLRLLSVLEQDLTDIRDILKTVSLMKWQAQRISELVSGYGELWSAQILCALLAVRSGERNERNKHLSTTSLEETSSVFRNHNFVYLDARLVITIDEEAIQDGAVVWDVSMQKITNVYEQQVQTIHDKSTVLHLVITGYVASNTNGVATTLQRDGSDYSAAIMGRLLQANSICIWTDVDGVLSADPRRVPLAQVIPEVSYNEAMELAYFGAKVIHPKTMQPAISCVPQIPIYIRNTFHAQYPGTRIFITSTTTKDREKVVCGFSSIENMALINVEGSGMIGVPGVAMRLFATLLRVGVNVVLISQASSEHSVSFATIEAHASKAKDAIEEEFARELRQNRISSVDVRAPCSIIAAVGDGMSSTTGVAGRFFSALGDAKINVVAIAQGSSERNISAVVWSKESTRALRAVHAAFSLSYSTVRVGIIGMGEVGESLVKLLETQRNALRVNFDIDLQVCAILPSGDSTHIVGLEDDNGSHTHSITIRAFQKAKSRKPSLDKSKTVFKDEETVATLTDGGVESFQELLFRSDCASHAVFDCTNDERVGWYHPEWLSIGIDVITANNTGLSGPKNLRDDIKKAEKMLGKQSAKYLRQVTVAGGLPILSTLRSLLHSGDRVRRIDGVFTVVMSYIMHRISPPPDVTQCSVFDKKFSQGAFLGDMATSTASEVGDACSFSQAVQEAIALGLTEDDPTKDFNNEYTARVLMVLARELGMDEENETKDICQASEGLFEMNGCLDFQNLHPEVDQRIHERVEAARSRGCVLRNVSSIDVKQKQISIQLVEVPNNHVFTITPPSCACVRFFTQRYQRYPLIIQGPSAGADSTASALLAELIQRTRGLSSPQSLALRREGSGAFLRRSSQMLGPPA